MLFVDGVMVIIDVDSLVKVKVMVEVIGNFCGLKIII